MAQTQSAEPAPKTRSQRWVKAETRTPAPQARSLSNVLVNRISVNRETEAICRGRAGAATTVAAHQARKASMRLEHMLDRGKTWASLASLMGALGLVGSLYVALVPLDPGPVRMTIGLLSTLAMALPLILTTIRALNEGPDREIEAATAAEGAMRVAAFSKQIGEAVASASDGVGLSPTALVVLAPLLDSVEREAETSRQREQTVYAADRTEKRAHKRIKPVHDRVIVTTGDGRKLTARILDLSTAGVALDHDLPGVNIGSVVFVGSHKALALRKLARGLAFQFETPLAEAAFHPEIVL